MAKDEASKKAREKEKEMIIQSMMVEEGSNVEKIIEQHNKLTVHSVTFIELLRDRSHDFDGLLNGVKGIVSVLNDSHDELKKEQSLLRKATDANTAAIAKLVTVGETSLAWFKGFLGFGGLAVIAGIAIGVIKILVGE
jgi:hypothetical protein